MVIALILMALRRGFGKGMSLRGYNRVPNHTFPSQDILNILWLYFPQQHAMFRILINQIKILLGTLTMIQGNDMFFKLISRQVIVLQHKSVSILIGAQSFGIDLFGVDVFGGRLGLGIGWRMVVVGHLRFEVLPQCKERMGMEILGFYKLFINQPLYSFDRQCRQINHLIYSLSLGQFYLQQNQSLLQCHHSFIHQPYYNTPSVCLIQQSFISFDKNSIQQIHIMTNTKAIVSALILISLVVVYYNNDPSTINSKLNLQAYPEAPVNCLGSLPFNIWNNPEAEYYNWYGLQGKSLTGKTYLTGHAFERHVAVNNACTLEQKQQNKTVFLNMNEFQKAAARIPCTCDLANHTSFTYDYNGKIASASEYISGIDCMTGAKQMFPAYFVQFKRAIRNAHPTQTDYLNSNFVTIWTFYPRKN